ncbi:MAG: putative 2OG-Fe(II) oxygenase [Betaproteobacteria bacterium]|nr:putative 2OG-Fe(II) oxygenase [Betaproteobacteria bacterium]
MNLAYLFPRRMEKAADGNVVLDWEGQFPFGAPWSGQHNDALSYPRVLPDCLSARECADIVALGERRLISSASVEGRSDLQSRDYRVGNISWIEPAEDSYWLYHRLGMLFSYLNEAYSFELVGLGESLQYTSYGPGQFFNWHIDNGAGGASLRKLSMTIQLSEPAGYTGGELEFHGVSEMPGARGQGSAICFPSFLAHRVSPMQHGLRRSLVAWAYGPAYR